jgi:hypothetical protein
LPPAGAPAVGGSGAPAAARRIVDYTAHAMGVNALCMAVQRAPGGAPGAGEGGDDGGERGGATARGARLLICTGGDDQAIGTAFIDVSLEQPQLARPEEQPPLAPRGALLRCAGAHVETTSSACGSAFKVRKGLGR